MEIESRDESENLLRRRQVRLNMRQTMGIIAIGSLSVLLGVLIYNVAKIIVVWVVLRSYLETCERPLKAWMWGILVLEGADLALVTEAYLRTCRTRELATNEAHPLLGRLNVLSRVYTPHSAYFLWQLLGNYWYYSCEDCAETAPHITKLVFWMLMLTYVYYLSLCVSICALLMCMPLLVILMRRFQITSPQGATESQLQSLIECLVEGGEVDECSICTVPFITGERITRMPCDERHRFHKECLFNWLRIKADCPICRRQLA